MSERTDYWNALRLWVAGRLFLIAGWVHKDYRVWLDNAEPRP